MVTKKIKFFAALAVASLVGLTSCSNNNEVTEGIDNGKEKSVFLKIEQPKSDNNFTTRAEGPSQAAETVNFGSGHLYFVASNKVIVKHYEITAEDNTPSEANLSKVGVKQLSDGFTFEHLPSVVQSVYIVGNTTITKVSGSIGGVVDQNIKVIDQLDLKNANLFGQAQLAKVLETENKFKAEVLVSPTVARLELTKIQSKGDVITGFKVKGIFVDNFFTEAHVDGDTPNTASTGGSSKDEFKKGTTTYDNELEKVVYDWYAKPLGAKPVENGFAAAPSVGDNVWGYNLFAKKGNKVAPRLVILISEIESVDGKYDGGELFLTAKLTKGGVRIADIEPSKVYTVGGENGIIFDETNLFPNPNGEYIDAEVTVTLATWEREDLGVEL